MPSVICTSGVHCANCQGKPETMRGLNVAKCAGPYTQPPTERDRSLPAGSGLRSPVSALSALAPFSRLHRVILKVGAASAPRSVRAWLRSGRCGCAARATRWDLALNRRLTPLYRRFKLMQSSVFRLRSSAFRLLRSVSLLSSLLSLLLLPFPPTSFADPFPRYLRLTADGVTNTYNLIELTGDGFSLTNLGGGVARLVITNGTSGTTDHSVLSNLVWTASGHTGTPARLAGFFEGGAAGYAGFGAGLYLDGSDNITISNAVLAGAAAGATAVQPAALAGYAATNGSYSGLTVGNALAGWPTQWSGGSITSAVANATTATVWTAEASKLSTNYNGAWLVGSGGSTNITGGGTWTLNSGTWTYAPTGITTAVQSALDGKANSSAVITVTGLGNSGSTTLNGGTITIGNAILNIATNGTAAMAITNTGTLNFIAGAGVLRTFSNAGNGQANLTMSLDDAGYDAFGRSLSALRQVPFSDMGSATVSGTVARNTGKLDLRTTSNAPTNAYAQVTMSYFNTEIGSGQSSRSLPMSWEIAGNINATWGAAGFWCGLGYFDQSTGLLTNKGIGVYMQTNLVLVSQVHNGTTFNAVTNGTFADAGKHSRLVCNYRSGVFNVYLTTVNPTVELSAPSLVASITNTLPATLGNAFPYNLSVGLVHIASNTTANAPALLLQYLRVSEWR